LHEAIPEDQAMDPFATLNDEHRLIERVISALLSYAERIDHGADPADLGRFVGLISGFADARHHGKEEDILFEAMMAAGFPRDAGPIGMMLFEHEQGRGFVATLLDCAGRAGAWTAQDRARIKEAAQGYAELLRQHIAKEDMVLYPMARRALPQEVVTLMEARFDELEGGEDAQVELEGFLSTADALFTRYLGTPALSVRPLSVRTVASVHH
jgi:hemerythrin-like domain-containing protein